MAVESHYPQGATVTVDHMHEGVYVGVKGGTEPLLQLGQTLGVFLGPAQARELAKQLEAEAAAWEE